MRLLKYLYPLSVMIGLATPQKSFAQAPTDPDYKGARIVSPCADKSEKPKYSQQATSLVVAGAAGGTGAAATALPWVVARGAVVAGPVGAVVSAAAAGFSLITGALFQSCWTSDATQQALWSEIAQLDDFVKNNFTKAAFDKYDWVEASTNDSGISIGTAFETIFTLIGNLAAGKVQTWDNASHQIITEELKKLPTRLAKCAAGLNGDGGPEGGLADETLAAFYACARDGTRTYQTIAQALLAFEATPEDKQQELPNWELGIKAAGEAMKALDGIVAKYKTELDKLEAKHMSAFGDPSQIRFKIDDRTFFFEDWEVLDSSQVTKSTEPEIKKNAAEEVDFEKKHKRVHNFWNPPGGGSRKDLLINELAAIPFNIQENREVGYEIIVLGKTLKQGQITFNENAHFNLVGYTKCPPKSSVYANVCSWGEVKKDPLFHKAVSEAILTYVWKHSQTEDGLKDILGQTGGEKLVNQITASFHVLSGILDAWLVDGKDVRTEICNQLLAKFPAQLKEVMNYDQCLSGPPNR